MKKIIIILIITLTTFMGENIYTNNKELKQNEYIANDVEIENKAEDKTSENILIIPEENEVIMKDNEIQETTDNEVIEEYISVEKSVATPKEEKKNEQPKAQKVQEVQKEETKVENIQQKEETKDEENEEITIHIIGEVKYPGIVILKSGQRIVDAIEAAGGETEEADLNKLNLAQLLNDGDKIYVPNKADEIEDYKDTTGKSSTVNLNTATLEELTSLPGIGESTAQKIIDYRKQNGKFKVIEDLKNVSGIGESKFDNIKDKITVR